MRFAPVSIAAVLAACSSSHSSSPIPADEDMSPTRPAVTIVAPPLVGTGGFGFGTGNAFPGAAAPQGLAKVGPDTSGTWGTIDFLHTAGYWYPDDTIRGFSHLHLHGTGVPDYGVLALMPLDAFDASRTSADGYASKYDKSTEAATPGKYSVTLARGGIRVEITATPHAAHHRFTYASGSSAAHVVFDLDHHLDKGAVKDESIDLDATARTVRGTLRNDGRMSDGFGGTPIYFAARTLRSWSSASVWSAGNPPASGSHAQGTGVGVDLAFDLGSTPAPVEIQVGLSLVSIDAAAANLAAEMPDFSFDAEAAATRDSWQRATSVVQAQGGSDAQQTMMQAALYHLFLMPTVLSDVDGGYVGVDLKTTKAQGFHYVSDMSLWDTYRTLHPLYDLLAPDRARDAAASLVAMAKARGSFPKWPLGDGESGTMIGASAEVVLADAYVKGIRGFDAEGAYQILRAAAMDASEPPGGRGGRGQVGAYMKLGYVPGNASETIEYGQDDVALANFAEALGHGDDARALRQRAHGWQKLWDADTGFLWAKNADGSWKNGHGDPTVWTDDFVEASAWQSVWGPWFDMDGLASVMGGSGALVDKLTTFFEQGKQDYDAIRWDSPLSVAGPRKYYFGGNEPDIHSVYLFALAGRPDMTQKWLRWIESEVYTAGADGLPGNDDGGTMSAWLVESMLGFYAVPGSDRYVVGAPAFPHAAISVPGGTFAIDAAEVNDTNKYVQSVTLNGSPLDAPVFHHSDLRAGGSLVFAMGPKASGWAHR